MSANPGALPGWFDPRIDHGRADHGRADHSHSDAADHSDEVNPDEVNKGGADRTDNTTAHTTTGGGKDDQTPVVVWEAANRMEAEIVAGRLRSEGIPAIIRGESLGAIYGLTTGSLAAANVLVPALLAEKALLILDSAVDWTAEWDESDRDDFSENTPPDPGSVHDPNG